MTLGMKMKRYQIAEAKSRFSEVLAHAETGEPVEIVRGKKRKPVAYIISTSMFESHKERVMGSVEHWGEISISDDWKITDEELMGS